VTEENTERRITAILSADVVGYSRLMGEDEAATLAALKADRKELFEPKAAQYRGRTVKLMGDGILMEFASVVDAVRFAVEVQCAMRERNAKISEERQIIYRVGINVGDIIVEGDDIYGDGVNIAARLESLAEPGGICIRRNVRNQVRDKLDLHFEDLGEVEVKNIARPIRIFRLILDEKAEAFVTPVVREVAKPERWRRPVTTAAVLLLLVASGILWWQPWAPTVEPASVKRMAFPLPDKPSIAVLPFDNMSGDPEQEYFADGMTEDLITDLSKISGLFVIARNSSFSYKGRQVKVRQVAEELGVRYILEGSVRRVGDMVRINAQLIDATTGGHLWAERYDGSLADVFALQDKVIAKIVSAMAVSLTGEETARTVEAETDVPEAYDAFLLGWELYRRQTIADNTKAINQLEKAVALDPGYGRAYAGLAAAYWDVVNRGLEYAVSVQWQHAFDKMEESIAKALEAPTATAYWVQAEILAAQGRFDEALVAIDHGVALEPNNPDIHVSKALILNAMGRAGEAEPAARLAMRLNPHYRPKVLRELGRALLHQERYEEAAAAFERVVSREEDNGYDFLSLAAIYGHLGSLEKAKSATQRYNKIFSEWGYTPMTVQEAGFWWYGDMFDYDEAYVATLREGLRKAGVPEGPAPAAENFDFKALVNKSEGTMQVEGAERIDPETAKGLSDRGAIIVDVRDAGSYARERIAGAVHLDLNADLTEANLSKLVGKDDQVIFTCWGKYCPYAAYSTAKAVLWGFSRVYYFNGGFPAWKDAGYLTESSPGY